MNAFFFAAIPAGTIGYAPGLQQVGKPCRCGGLGCGVWDVLVEPEDNLRLVRLVGSTFTAPPGATLVVFSRDHRVLGEVIQEVLDLLSKLGRVFALASAGIERRPGGGQEDCNA